MAESTNPYLFQNEHVAVDLSLVVDVTGNNEVYINKMIQMFLEKMPDNLEKIEQGIKSQDWEITYNAAHSTKSSLSIVKIVDVFDWVLQIEVNAKNKTSLDILPDLIKKIKEKFHFAQALLVEKFQTNCLPL
jgi:HPt (histidine-containing phosphotransfer) domain-containing protein